MTQNLTELLETSQISEPEIVDLLKSLHRLVNGGLFNQAEFDWILNRLGIKQEGNTFIFNEDMSYTFN